MPSPSPRHRRRPPTSLKSCASCMQEPRAPTATQPEEIDMPEAFICDGMRTPIGRYGGALAKVRTDDLAAVPIKALMKRHSKADWSQLRSEEHTSELQSLR